jgi:hypothetical protein
MIREFYISFAYGSAKYQTFLEAAEIPRYVLLPLSSFVLGPVGLALLQAGAIEGGSQVSARRCTRDCAPDPSIAASIRLVAVR